MTPTGSVTHMQCYPPPSVPFRTPYIDLPEEAEWFQRVPTGPPIVAPNVQRSTGVVEGMYSRQDPRARVPTSMRPFLHGRIAINLYDY